MKVQIKTLAFALLAIMVSSMTFGAVKYGDAVIEKGNLVIVREGRMYLFTEANNPVVLYENDTVRTLKNTSLTLNNPDQNRIVLGSNAVMQLKKWQQKKETGFVRMLFGKFRARTAVARKRSSLNIRTATATIGIKGSLGEGTTNSEFTSLSNLSGTMSMTNGQGQEIDVPVGQFSFNVDGRDQGFNTQPNPNFDPNKSEDEMETSDSEQLDTEDTKEVDVPPVIEQTIEEKVVEVAELEEEVLTESPADGDQTVTDSIFKDVQDAQDEASQVTPTIDVKITIED